MRQGQFHLFKKWTSAKPWPMINVIWQSLGLGLVNINVLAKAYQNIPHGSRVRASLIFFFFSIATLAKARLMINDIWQFIGIDIVINNVYAKLYCTIPYISRVRASYTFSEFWPRQSLDEWHTAFGNPLGYSVSISMGMRKEPVTHF